MESEDGLSKVTQERWLGQMAVLMKQSLKMYAMMCQSNPGFLGPIVWLGRMTTNHHGWPEPRQCYCKQMYSKVCLNVSLMKRSRPLVHTFPTTGKEMGILVPRIQMERLTMRSTFLHNHDGLMRSKYQKIGGHICQNLPRMMTWPLIHTGQRMPAIHHNTSEDASMNGTSRKTILWIHGI